MVTWVLVLWLLNATDGRVTVKAVTYPSMNACLGGYSGATSSAKYTVLARSECVKIHEAAGAPTHTPETPGDEKEGAP